MQALAKLGFIVVQIDGMGTATRSKGFHDVGSKNVKDAGFADRILWHKVVAVKYSYYDISRVGSTVARRAGRTRSARSSFIRSSTIGGVRRGWSVRSSSVPIVPRSMCSTHPAFDTRAG